jgi:hypothetical protein
MQKAKRGGVAKNVDEYLDGVAEPGRRTLQKVREIIRSVVPAETTEAIGYGIHVSISGGVGCVWSV